jgi:hypothetical protein
MNKLKRLAFYFSYDKKVFLGALLSWFKANYKSDNKYITHYSNYIMDILTWYKQVPFDEILTEYELDTNNPMHKGLDTDDLLMAYHKLIIQRYGDVDSEYFVSRFSRYDSAAAFDAETRTNTDEEAPGYTEIQPKLVTRV